MASVVGTAFLEYYAEGIPIVVATQTVELGD
jgi:hypothetical protein